MNLLDLGINIDEIMLPNKNIDLQKWSVVACDQYTSEPQYWSDVQNFVGDAPSTLKIVVPEIYLEDLQENKIKDIKATMQNYEKDGTLVKLPKGVVVVERFSKKQSDNQQPKARKGVMLCLDLEKYDFSAGSESLLRATEGTVVERIPPRLKVRNGAKIECPHILILIDDINKMVVEPLFDLPKTKVYDFELMQNGGHLTGHHIEEKNLEGFKKAFEKLFEESKNRFNKKQPLLFAAGDGNHSLACAKTNWETIKKTLTKGEIENHSARFALCEVENIHDEAIEFEPIHRVVFNVDENFFEKLTKILIQQNPNGVSVAKLGDFQKHKSVLEANNGHAIEFVSEKFCGTICVSAPEAQLEVGTLQNAIDEYLKQNAASTVDYIHGDDVTKKLGEQKGNVGFFLPKMDKNVFFKTVILEGSLPRKTFSMGDANQKRFYLECRSIL